MQENEFEKKVREKMEGLHLAPGEEVWEKVSAGIYKEKRKRRFLIFLFAFALLSGMGGIFLYIGANKTKPALAFKNDAAPHQKPSAKTGTDIEGKVASVEKNSFGKTIHLTSETTLKERKKKEQQGISRKQLYGSKRNIETKKPFQLSASATVSMKQTEVKSNAPVKSTEAVVSTPQPAQTELTEQNKPATKSITGKDIVSVVPSTKPITETKKDTVKPVVMESKPAPKIKTPSSKKWNAGFTVFSGISNNLSHLNIFSFGSASNLYSSSPGTVTSGNPGTSTSISSLNYKSSFSYGFGFYLKKQLSKKINFSSGVNYHFASASSLVGNVVDSSLNFFNAVLNQSTTVNRYFSVGNSIKYTNKYYMLELPLNVFIRLNKNQERPILLSAGMSPGYLIHSKALYANNTQNVYYTNNDQFKKLYLGLQTGLQFTFYNAHHFDVTAGPEVWYGLSNMAKSATNTNQHLLRAGVGVKVTLK